MMEKYGEVLETKCLDPKLSKEQRVGETNLFIPTITTNFSRGGERDFV